MKPGEWVFLLCGRTNKTPLLPTLHKQQWGLKGYKQSDFDAKDVHLGHSYFLLDENNELTESEQLQLKLDYEILPILNEYVKDGLLLESAKDLIKELEKFEC